MRRLPQLLLLFAAALFTTAAFASPLPTAAPQAGYGPGQGPGGTRITCSSNDGRRNFCNADTRGGVRLSRQISGTACIQGRTWGYNRNAVWVDRGCRAEFVLLRPAPPPFRVVTCSSNNNRRNWCPVPPRADVRLGRQLSSSPCVRGKSWGTDRQGIWVDRGCRADFQVR